MSLALLLALFAAPQAGRAASLSNLSGKYTGVLIIAQGASTRIVGGANTRVTLKGKTGKFAIKGAIGKSSFTQTITLGSGGQATVSAILPGLSDFSQTVTGTYSAHGQHVTITAPLPNPYRGTFTMKIETATFGQVLSISTKAVISGFSDPVYVSVTGA